MLKAILKRNEIRRKRALHRRKKLQGTPGCPRLCVVKSNKHLQAQLIDDENRLTLAYVSTLSKELQDKGLGRKNKDAARELGTLIGKLAQEKAIERVVFDRGPCKYHGVLKELADAARAAGLKF